MPWAAIKRDTAHFRFEQNVFFFSFFVRLPTHFFTWTITQRSQLRTEAIQQKQITHIDGTMNPKKKEIQFDDVAKSNLKPFVKCHLRRSKQKNAIMRWNVVSNNENQLQKCTLNVIAKNGKPATRLKLQTFEADKKKITNKISWNLLDMAQQKNRAFRKVWTCFNIYPPPPPPPPSTRDKATRKWNKLFGIEKSVCLIWNSNLKYFIFIANKCCFGSTALNAKRMNYENGMHYSFHAVSSLLASCSVAPISIRFRNCMLYFNLLLPLHSLRMQ